MPMCGFNPKMLKGLALFSQGLYEQALKRSQEENLSMERSFEIEVEEMNIFLTMLDDKYYGELRPRHNIKEAMDKLIEWMTFYPKKDGF